MTELMPAIFFGHGNPMNAIKKNEYSDAWANIGKRLPRPKAILCVSSHWYVPSAAVTAAAYPGTLHDFGGFPPQLSEVRYAAPGEPDLASRVRNLLAPVQVNSDDKRGFDHGVWSVLSYAYPEADIPVVQLSIDNTQPARIHYDLAKKLAPLRGESVLIIGSGNIVHNLRLFSWDQPLVAPNEWAVDFEQNVRDCILARRHKSLINYESLGPDAMMSVPTPDHYLPLLYVLALQNDRDKISFPVEGFEGGSISMLSVEIGSGVKEQSN